MLLTSAILEAFVVVATPAVPKLKSASCGDTKSNVKEIFRDVFEKALKKALKDVDVKISAPLKKAILSALSEKDDTAEACTDAKGNIEADSDLRDHELVPLKEDWQDYVEREVKPFVPDAWVDESHKDAGDGQTGRVGYEINFNRYFYKYVPPRPVAEIDEELKTLEAEIANLLKGVAA